MVLGSPDSGMACGAVMIADLPPCNIPHIDTIIFPTCQNGRQNGGISGRERKILCGISILKGKTCQLTSVGRVLCGCYASGVHAGPAVSQHLEVSLVRRLSCRTRRRRRKPLDMVSVVGVTAYTVRSRSRPPGDIIAKRSQVNVIPTGFNDNQKRNQRQ